MAISNMTRRSFVSTAIAAPFVLKAGVARAATVVKFSLAAPFDGSNAAFFLAQQKGWYKDAGLECQFDAGGGSGEAVSRVGSGVYDAGIADINSMAEFNAKNAGAAIRMVYMVYFRSPLCVGTLAKSGIAKPGDLAGKTIGAAAPDGAYRLFSTYAKATNIDTATVKWNMVGLQLREAVLARGDVDAILGFDSTMYFGLIKAGIKPDDIKFLYYADAGLDLYGNGIILSDKFRTQNAAVAKAFVEVSALGWQAAVKDPKAAIAALKDHSPLINADLEEQKLLWLIKNQLTTDESSGNGLGAIDEGKLARSMEAVAVGFGLPSVPKVADIFDASFQPSADIRRLPA
ncbi:ABC transporter substrate-binding protein [Labrys monachus]|uniref:Thiamine pyrimidine synthase n=1 Tax=Labrys monachus TaxID=217067 RepID=A0ABU0F7L0_9HYPH|nr:ABC transporter substrate-binding protein [Labrys monachus]MDQ0390421.1 NitT/TauT family transport system substrate-binding protein [Labrys monachus]